MALHREDGVIIEHPNREKASSKTTKAAVIFLLLGSAALVTIITVGAWSHLAGAQPVQIGYIAVYLLMAYYVSQWNRGVLPVAAALAIILLIFAAVSGDGWFQRDKDGYDDSGSADLFGLLTYIIVPVQALLVAFAMRGFGQSWNVEVERHPDGTTRAAPQRG